MIYNLNSNGTVSCIYKTMSQNSSKMYLNVYHNHYSYITNFQKFAKKFQCEKCSKIFKKIWHLKRHTSLCYERTKYIFPGGFHKTQPTIFDKLESLGLKVNQADKYFPNFIVWDMETMLQKINLLLPQKTKNCKWLTKHVPISIASNVCGFEEPKCIVKMNEEILINKIMCTLIEISKASYDILTEKYSSIILQLDELIERYQSNQTQDSECESNESTNDILNEKQLLIPFINLKKEFERYLKQIPVLGFNSGRYDLNLIKKQIMAYITYTYKQNEIFTIKKNTYISIGVPEMKFIIILPHVVPIVNS